MKGIACAVGASLMAMLLVIASLDDAADVRLSNNNNNNNPEAIMLQGNPAPRSSRLLGSQNRKPAAVAARALAGIGDTPTRSGISKEAGEAAAVAMQSALALLGAKQASPKQPEPRPSLSKKQRAAAPVVQLATPEAGGKVAELKTRLHALEDRMAKLQRIRAANKKHPPPAKLSPPSDQPGATTEEALAWAPVGDGVKEAEAELGTKVSPIPSKTLDDEYHQTTGLIDKLLHAQPHGYNKLLESIRDFEHETHQGFDLAVAHESHPVRTPANAAPKEEEKRDPTQDELTRYAHRAQLLAGDQEAPPADDDLWDQETPPADDDLWRKAQLQRQIQKQQSLLAAESGQAFREIATKQATLDQAKIQLAHRKLQAAAAQRHRTDRLQRLTQRESHLSSQIEAKVSRQAVAAVEDDATEMAHAAAPAGSLVQVQHETRPDMVAKAHGTAPGASLQQVRHEAQQLRAHLTRLASRQQRVLARRQGKLAAREARDERTEAQLEAQRRALSREKRAADQAAQQMAKRYQILHSREQQLATTQHEAVSQHQLRAERSLLQNQLSRAAASQTRLREKQSELEAAKRRFASHMHRQRAELAVREKALHIQEHRLQLSKQVRRVARREARPQGDIPTVDKDEQSETIGKLQEADEEEEDEADEAFLEAHQAIRQKQARRDGAAGLLHPIQTARAKIAANVPPREAHAAVPPSPAAVLIEDTEEEARTDAFTQALGEADAELLHSDRPKQELPAAGRGSELEALDEQLATETRWVP